jgi:choline dehydrogenase-like flavoprotein
LLELELPVAGPSYYPWGDPHGYPYGPQPMGGIGDALIRGCTNLEIGVSAGGPVAILSGSRGYRPLHLPWFLHPGVGAKASTLITHVPDALANGAELRPNSMVSRIEMGSSRRASGVTFIDANGRERFQKAKAVVIAGYSIETPRLLLNSATSGFEKGLANSSDCVGRYLMAQAGNVVLGRFDEPLRMYKAPPAHALTEQFYETDPRRDFARGFAIQTVGPLPISFAKQMMVAKGA